MRKRVFIVGRTALDAYDYFQKNLIIGLEIEDISAYRSLVKISTKRSDYLCFQVEDASWAGRCHEMYVTKNANTDGRYFTSVVAPLCNLGEAKIVIEE